MKNKELGFDYIYEFLYNNNQVGSQIPGDDRFDDEDKSALQAIISDLSTMSINSHNFAALSQQEREKSMSIATELSIKNMENTYGTIMGIKDALQDVIKDAKSAYKYVLWMYVAAFLLGIALIAVAIVFAARGQTILAVAFGAIGLVDLVTQFIYKPPLELQSSRSNLAQLMIAITNWFADLMNLNTYMANQGTGISLETIRALSDMQNNNTAKILDLIEQYSEPSVHNNDD